MFKGSGIQLKKIAGHWWAAIIVIGAALMLFLGQTAFPIEPPQPAPATATVQPAEAPAENTAEDGSFLDQYDPDAVSLLDTTDQNGVERSGWEVGTDLFLKLALVLGLVYIAMHALRWLQGQKQAQSSPGTTINVLETTGLAPGRSLHLVVVGEKTLLIGVTEQQISLLTELADARVPVPEATVFDETLDLQQQSGEPDLPELLDSNEPAAEYSSDWQTTLDDLRAGIRRMQDSVKVK